MMAGHAKTSRREWARPLGCLALILSCVAQGHAQGYDGRAAAQRVRGNYGVPGAAAVPTAGYRARAPYAEPTSQRVGRASYGAPTAGTVYRQASRPAGYRPAGEVRGNDVVQPVRYQAEVVPQEEMIIGPEVPVQMGEMPAQPVEIIEEGSTYYEQGESCSSCSSCGSSTGGICDPAYRSHGCDREPCPCPSDEALSYHRCNHYGHYPTLWRTWPEGFLKYRPEPQDTLYDRFRKAPKGMDRAAGEKKDEDLDKQLKDLLKEQEGPNAKGARTPSGGPNERPAPDLLPDDPPVDSGAAPAPKDGSYFRRQPIQSPNAVRPVGWNR